MPPFDKTNDKDKKMSLAGQIQAAIAYGTSFADLQGVSEATLIGMYALAYDFYKKGQLDDAEHFFKFLCIYDLKNPDYLRGYAAVCQLKKDYQRAYDLYCMSYTIDDCNDYQSVYYMGQCQLGLKNAEGAKLCFSSIIDGSKDDELVKKSRVYLELLETAPTEDSSAEHQHR